MARRPWPVYTLVIQYGAVQHHLFFSNGLIIEHPMGHVDPFYIAMVNYHRVPTMWIIPRIATATTPTTPQQQQQTRRAVQRKRHLQASQQVRESKGTWKCGFHQGFTRESGKSGEIYFKYMAFSEKKLWNFLLTSLLWGIAYFQTRPHGHINRKNDEKEIKIVKLGRFAVAILTIPLYCI